MATMTYDPSENTGELTAEEQESLAVGEKMQEQEAQLLAGKYKDAEELEKAYVELQSKLGSEEKAQPKAEETEAEPEEKPEEVDFFDSLWEESQSDSEKYSDEIMGKLKDMDQTELAQAYLEQRALANQAPQQEYLTEGDAKSLKDMVGGEAKYSEMLKWANTGFNKQEIDLYDKIMESGNRAAAYFAVQALAQRYGNSQGVEGEMLKGQAPKAQKGDVFKSQASVVRAMSDPKYDKDPAYRQEIMEKLSRSNVNF